MTSRAQQIPLFPPPVPAPDPSSVAWVKDALRKGDNRRDDGKGDKYDPDKFIESTNKEAP